MKGHDEGQYLDGAQEIAEEMFYGGDVKEKEVEMQLVDGGVTGGTVPEFYFGPGSEGLEMYDELRGYVLIESVDAQAAGTLYGQALEIIEEQLQERGFDSNYELDIQSPSGRKQVKNGDVRGLVGAAIKEAEEETFNGEPDPEDPAYRMALTVENPFKVAFEEGSDITEQETSEVAELLK